MDTNFKLDAFEINSDIAMIAYFGKIFAHFFQHTVFQNKFFFFGYHFHSFDFHFHPDWSYGSNRFHEKNKKNNHCEKHCF